MIWFPSEGQQARDPGRACVSVPKAGRIPSYEAVRLFVLLRPSTD